MSTRYSISYCVFRISVERALVTSGSIVIELRHVSFSPRKRNSKRSVGLSLQGVFGKILALVSCLFRGKPTYEIIPLTLARIALWCSP